jgi:hypothetical protein
VVTIVEAYLDSIAITPPQPTASVGTTLPFRAVGTFLTSPAPFTQDLTDELTWRTSMPSVARLRNLAGHGQAMAFATGTTMISATFVDVTASTSMSVVAP